MITTSNLSLTNAFSQAFVMLKRSWSNLLPYFMVTVAGIAAINASGFLIAIFAPPLNVPIFTITHFLATFFNALSFFAVTKYALEIYNNHEISVTESWKFTFSRLKAILALFAIAILGATVCITAITAPYVALMIAMPPQTTPDALIRIGLYASVVILACLFLLVKYFLLVTPLIMDKEISVKRAISLNKKTCKPVGILVAKLLGIVFLFWSVTGATIAVISWLSGVNLTQGYLELQQFTPETSIKTLATMSIVDTLVLSFFTFIGFITLHAYVALYKQSSISKEI